MGHKRTFWDARAMSALPPKADIREPRTVSAKGKKLATAASLLIATVRSSRLQAVGGQADVWPVRHLRPEAMPDRVIQPAPEATLDPNRCVRTRRDRLCRNSSPRHAATQPSDLSAARLEGRGAFRGRG